MVSTAIRYAKANGINKVAVVDDAYAPVSASDLDGNCLALFSNALSDDASKLDEAATLLKIETFNPQVPAKIQGIVNCPEHLAKLWRLAVSDKDHWLNQTLFLSYRNSVDDMAFELAGLSNVLKKFKWNADELFDIELDFDVTAYQVIFLDVYLKNEIIADQAICRAVKLGEMIQSARQKVDKFVYPLVFLMSSRDGAEVNQYEFKKRTGLRADFFTFIRKDAIAGNFEPTLEDLLAHYRQRQDLAKLLDEYWLAALRASHELREDLAVIEPSELALLHEAELGVEQAVLPDYLSWLVSELIAAKLVADRSVREAGAQIPAMLKHSPFPGMVPPTSRLAEMYVRSVMRLDITDDIEETKGWRVHLGDLFIQAKRAGDGPERFVLVVDQSCDLARPSSKENVLCLQCEPIELDDVSLAFYRSLDSGAAPSDLVSILENDKTRYFLALWDIKNPITPKLNDLQKRNQRFKRIARYKAVRALARQEALTAQVGRIGEPVLPPNAHAFKAKLVLNGKVEGSKKEFDALKEAWASVVVVQGRHVPYNDGGKKTICARACSQLSR